MEPTDQPDQRRGTCLYVMLATGAVVFFLLFLALITGGWFLYLMYVVAGITAFGAFHYLVWGRALSRATEAEREEERWREEQREAERRPPPDSTDIRRF